MKISGVTGTSGIIQAQGTGINAGTDNVSKNLQQQIAYAQQQLQQLSSNENLSPEEKMKKRQEIQQEISSLNQQLRQHQMELKKQQTAGQDQPSSGSRETGNEKTEGRRSGLSQAGMEAMISADSSIKQAQVQSGVATRLEGRARVLESEIKMDAGRGGSVEKKEAELSDLTQRAQNASMAQTAMLAEANQTMAGATDSEVQKNQKKTQDGEEPDSKAEDTSVQEESNHSAQGEMPANYKPVNVLL